MDIMEVDIIALEVSITMETFILTAMEYITEIPVQMAEF